MVLTPDGRPEQDDVVMVEIVTDSFDPGWWRTYAGHDARRRRCRQRLEEQAAVSDCQRHAGRRTGGATPPDGCAWFRQEGQLVRRTRR